MKKTYISPRTVAMEMELQQMVCTSSIDGLNSNLIDTEVDGSAALSNEIGDVNLWE